MTGTFLNGLFEGEGTLTLKSGETYIGTFKAGKLDGTINHQLNEGTFIEVYKDDKLVSSKKVETTTLANNNSNAINQTITYNDGDKYVGSTVNGIKKGFGKYTFKTGNYYEGNWESDKANGFGTFLDEDGTKYEGSWKDNIKDGKITKTEKFGAITEENWKNGKLNGKSIITSYDDGILEITIEILYVDGKVTGNPKVTYPSGDQYEGEWEYGKPNGFGIYTYKDGDTYKGNFRLGNKYGLVEFKTKKQYDGRQK